MRQHDVEHEARRIFRDQGRNIAHMLPVYENAGIETRYACTPLAFGAWGLALAFTALKAAVLALRIGSEERALGKRP